MADHQARIADRYGDFLAEHPIAVWSSWDATAPAIYASQTTAGPEVEYFWRLLDYVLEGKPAAQ